MKKEIVHKLGFFSASIVTAIFLIATMYSLGAQEHVHDASCGYQEVVVGHDCNHIHDKTCGYIEAKQEIPCNQQCRDIDDDGIIDHSETCAYRPAIIGQFCLHVHDETCGYVVQQEGHPCMYNQVKENPVVYSNEVTTYDQLNTAINSATGTKENPTVISLGGNTIVLSNYISVTNKHILIENGRLTFDDTSVDNLNRQIVFDIYQSTVSFRDVTIEGNNFTFSKLFNVEGDLTLTGNTTIQNMNFTKAIIFGTGNSSNIHLESDVCIQYCGDTTTYASYIELSYGAKLYINGATLDGPGATSKTDAIKCSSTAKTQDVFISSVMIQNFSTGISTNDGVLIEDAMIKNVNIGISLNYVGAIVDFRNGIIQDCLFAAIRANDGNFIMSGGTITNCTTDTQYTKYAAIYILGGNIQLEGGKIVNNVANGIYAIGGSMVISGDIEISGNKIGIHAVATAILHMTGGKVINNDDGVYLPNISSKMYFGGSAQIHDNKDGDLYLPSDNETNKNINIIQDFTSPAKIVVTSLTPLTQGETFMVAFPDATYHDGQLVGDEIKYFSSSDSNYQVTNKDNTLILEYNDPYKSVSFVTNTTQELEDIKVLKGSTITQPTLQNTGYTLEGWFSDASYIKPWNFTTDVIDKDIILYAKWTPIEYHITYLLHGGNMTNNPTTYTIETPSFAINQPTMTGYTFVGWAYDNTVKQNITIQKGSIGDKILEAKWKINTYTVQFNSNGGSVIASQTIEYGKKVTKPNDPAKEDCIFIGWYLDENCTQAWNFENDTITSNLILYAKYQNKVKVPTSSVASNTKVTIGTLVELSTATSGASIFYTIDGSVPSKNSYLYNGPITINEDTTLRVIAIKDGYIDSDTVTFVYRVSGEVTVDVKVSGDGNIQVPKEEKIIAAVLEDKDYQALKSGQDILIVLKCETIAMTESALEPLLVQNHQVGQFLDISIFKQIGDHQEQVTKLRQPIDIVIQVPDQLLPDKAVQRTYSLIRIHDDEQTLLPDKDTVLETVTVESDRFSTYVLLYKDEVVNENIDIIRPSIDTSDTSQNSISYILSMFISFMGIIYVHKKERYY